MIHRGYRRSFTCGALTRRCREEVETMKKTLKRTAVVGGIALALTVPAGVALAAAQPGPAGNGSATCTYDQDRDRLQLRDGTGPRHDAVVSGTTIGANAHSYQAGPLDGSGPRADRPLDGTGNQFGR
jgi:hypothetical protein